jgi:hypothetical protein
MLVVVISTSRPWKLGSRPHTSRLTISSTLGFLLSLPHLKWGSLLSHTTLALLCFWLYTCASTCAYTTS